MDTECRNETAEECNLCTVASLLHSPSVQSCLHPRCILPNGKLVICGHMHGAHACRTSATGQQLMLNSDMCLLLDIFNETSGGTSPQPGIGVGGVSAGTPTKPVCTYDTCGESPTAGLVREFAANNTLFMAEFTAVWIKMVTKGYDVCNLSVLPAEGEGPDFEQLYGIDVLTAGCAVAPGAASFEYSGPVTTGVLTRASTPSLPSEGPAAAAGAPQPVGVAQEGDSGSPLGAGRTEASGGIGLGAGAATVAGALTPMQAGEAAEAVEGATSGTLRLGCGSFWGAAGAALLALYAAGG